MNKIAHFLTARVKSITHVNVAQNYFSRHIDNFEKKQYGSYVDWRTALKEINKAGEDFMEFLGDVAARTFEYAEIKSGRPTQVEFDVSKSSKDIGQVQVNVSSANKEVPYNSVTIWYHKPDKITLDFYNKKVGRIDFKISSVLDVEKAIKKVIKDGKVK